MGHKVHKPGDEHRFHSLTHPHVHPPAGSPRLRRTRIPSRVLVQTKAVLSRQAKRLARKADELEHVISKVTYCLGVLCFGIFCFLLGSRPYDVPRLYAAFFLMATPLRWIYYRSKKWHYFLLDFCYYANAILVAFLVFFPMSQHLFLVCFAFSEGPLAWALIVWRCSLVFSSVDKIVSVLIHLLPGTVIFIIRWWDPVTFHHHSADDTGPWPAWPHVASMGELWVWMLVVPLIAYSLWQILYWLVVEVLRKRRLVRDPEVMTSFRELSKKASRANNFWWWLSGVLGDSNRFLMYALIQGVFTVATVALTVPMFCSYRFHALFQIFKIAASIWNGGNFIFDVLPRQVHAKRMKKAAKAAEGGGVSSPEKDPLLDTPGWDAHASSREERQAEKRAAAAEAADAAASLDGAFVPPISGDFLLPGNNSWSHVGASGSLAAYRASVRGKGHGGEEEEESDDEVWEEVGSDELNEEGEVEGEAEGEGEASEEGEESGEQGELHHLDLEPDVPGGASGGGFGSGLGVKSVIAPPRNVLYTMRLYGMPGAHDATDEDDLSEDEEDDPDSSAEAGTGSGYLVRTTTGLFGNGGSTGGGLFGGSSLAGGGGSGGSSADGGGSGGGGGMGGSGGGIQRVESSMWGGWWSELWQDRQPQKLHALGTPSAEDAAAWIDAITKALTLPPPPLLTPAADAPTLPSQPSHPLQQPSHPLQPLRTPSHSSKPPKSPRQAPSTRTGQDDSPISRSPQAKSASSSSPDLIGSLISAHATSLATPATAAHSLFGAPPSSADVANLALPAATSFHPAAAAVSAAAAAAADPAAAAAAAAADPAAAAAAMTNMMFPAAAAAAAAAADPAAAAAAAAADPTATAAAMANMISFGSGDSSGMLTPPTGSSPALSFQPSPSLSSPLLPTHSPLDSLSLTRIPGGAVGSGGVSATVGGAGGAGTVVGASAGVPGVARVAGVASSLERPGSHAPSSQQQLPSSSSHAPPPPLPTSSSPSSAVVASPSKWRLDRCQNGLRFFEEASRTPILHRLYKLPVMKAVGVVKAAPDQIFDLVMSFGEERAEWDAMFAEARVVEAIDGHTDVVHMCLKRTSLWTRSRDLCLLRYWKREENGTYRIRVLQVSQPPQVPSAMGSRPCAYLQWRLHHIAPAA
ncbi:unnamed protein product [Closterium sp. Naga37s-1]|nr:unnamed protein product [Closterium sp. Naga37s-1]